MIHLNLKINKGIVYNEVEKLTSYAGAKLEEAGGAGSYDLNRVVDGNREMLERFWAEACASATTSLKHYSFIDKGYHPQTHGAHLEDDYEIMLVLPDNFKESLRNAIESSLQSYLIEFISAQWFGLMNKEASAIHAANAKGIMEDIIKMIYTRVRPKRY